MTPHESAQPCGCDPGAKWLCERHQQEATRLGNWTVTPTQPQLDPTVLTRAERGQIQYGATFGDCVSCDGYVLDPSEAPHCPSCARLKREGKAL